MKRREEQLASELVLYLTACLRSRPVTLGYTNYVNYVSIQN